MAEQPLTHALPETDYNRIAIETADVYADAKAALQRETSDRARGPADLFQDYNRPGLGVALEYERMGNQPVSDALRSNAEKYGYDLEHLGITIGTVVHNIDLKHDLTDEKIRLIRDVLLERKVVFFRDQHLTEDEQVTLSSKFGGLDAFPFGKTGDNPYIYKIHNDASRPGSINNWHTDVTWMEQPSLGSIAQLVEVPPVGGDTLFSDSHACYLGLPRALQERIEYLHGVNDYRTFLRGLSTELIASIKSRIPFGVSHPLVRTHPETGKQALYLHAGFIRHASLFDSRTGVALAPEESKDIIRQLSPQHNRPDYMCRFSWQQGSIAFWDNRAVQHYAVSDYFPHTRLLRRVTISGDKPYYDPNASA